MTSPELGQFLALLCEYVVAALIVVIGPKLLGASLGVGR